MDAVEQKNALQKDFFEKKIDLPLNTISINSVTHVTTKTVH